MQQSFAQIANEIASEAQAAFPGELENLVVLIPSLDNPLVYAASAVAAHLKKNPAAIKGAAKEKVRQLRKDNAIGMAEKNYYLAGVTVNVIAIDANLSKSYGRFTKEMDFIDTVHHEIGHLILSNGYPSSRVSRNLAESAASTYALLRHIQRFGKKVDYEEGVAARNARHIVLDLDLAHYVSDSLERAIQIAEEKEDMIYGLSLRDTAMQAELIADYCHLDNKTLYKISDAFIPSRSSFGRNAPPEKYLQKAVSVMEKYRHDADVFMAGKRYFSHPGISSLISEWAKAASSRQDAAYWQQAQKFIQDPKAEPPGYGHRRRLHFKR